MQDLQAYFAEQRTKFEKQRDDARAKLEEAELELRALDAYEQTKKQKPLKASTSDGEKKHRAPRQSGKRVEILSLVQQFPDGATSAQLQDRLNIRGNKQAVQSLSNALASLKKAGKINLENGIYRAA